MKILLLITAVVTLLLTGCSSTYKVSEFLSKDKFYENFNKSASDGTAEITLGNDSVLVAERGAQILNDSLTFTERILKEENKLSMGEVKRIEYIDYANHSGNIILNNDNKLSGEKIKVLSDSTVQFFSYRKIDKQIPIKNIKEVSYKNHLHSTTLGFIGGVILGVTVDLLVVGLIKNHNQGEAETVNHDILDIFIGTTIAGGIVGYLTGYTYIYQFNK
jgi:hypothetical protein